MKIWKTIMAFAVVLFAVCMYVKPAEAAKAVKPITLQNGRTISKYDVTGDGKKDTVKIKCTKSASSDYEGYGAEWQIFINGKSVHRMVADWECWQPEVELYRVSKKRVYLMITLYYPYFRDVGGAALFQMKKGKLRNVCDFYDSIVKSMNRDHYRVYIRKLTSKSITVECENQMNVTAHIAWRMNYVYKNGKWKKTGNVHNVIYSSTGGYRDQSSGWTATKRFNVYTTTSFKKRAFVVKKDQVVKIKKLCIKNGKTYFQITNKKGKKGWISNSNSCYYGCFKEAEFVQ